MNALYLLCYSSVYLHSGIWWICTIHYIIILFFCIIVDAFGLNLYYTSNICMYWTPAICRHIVSPCKDKWAETVLISDPLKIYIYIIINMMATIRNHTGCFLHMCSSHTLSLLTLTVCRPSYWLLKSFPLPTSPNHGESANSILSTSNLWPYLISLLTFTHLSSCSSDIHISEKSFLPISWGKLVPPNSVFLYP